MIIFDLLPFGHLLFNISLNRSLDLYNLEVVMKRFFCFLITFCLLYSPIATFAASKEEIDTTMASIPVQNWPQAPELTSEAAILMDANSGTILYAKNATQTMYPASTTKLMTALLTVENTSPEEVITFSRTAVNSLPAGSSHIGMRAGESLSVKDCLYGILLPSANEVANALAERISGSISSFVSLMNTRAAELGLINTHFSNPNGLHEDSHYSCAYDLAIILKQCIQNQTFLEVASRPTYVREPDALLNKRIPMASTNDMIRPNREYYDPDVVCGKTGWTEQAGRCLVTYASRNGMNLICVTMNAVAPNQFTDTKQLLDYGFEQFSLVNISESDHSYDSSHLIDSPLHFQQETKRLVQLNPSSHLLLPVNISFDQLERRISNKNTSSAIITYYYQNYALGSTSIVPLDSNATTNLFRDQTTLPEQISNLSITPTFVIPLWGISIFLISIAILLFGLLKGFQREQKYPRKSPHKNFFLPTFKYRYKKPKKSKLKNPKIKKSKNPKADKETKEPNNE